MNKDKEWKVYWNDYSMDSYLYGSQVDFKAKDCVEFKNLLMPPGTVIKTWYSMVNFQEKRVEPALPIIDGEGKYHISTDIESDVESGILIRLLFSGKNGEEAGSLYIDQAEADFTCPLKTYSYQAQLIAAGAHSMTFHSFTITERT